jgi:hypothetical protein
MSGTTDPRAHVEKLVARFGEHVEAYKRGDYNETQLRRGFSLVEMVHELDVPLADIAEIEADEASAWAVAVTAQAMHHRFRAELEALPPAPIGWLMGD